MMKSKKVTVYDKMQSGYSYRLTESSGENFAADFRPSLSPKQALSMGIFGGVYMRDCSGEFPHDWFYKAKFAVGRQHKDINFFGVQASQSLKIWRQKGWLHAQDPRGWFQWYCRYYMGRRSADDMRQIKRWKAMSRHIMQLKKNCLKGDLTCRPRQRQALLHWAIDSRMI